MAGPLLGFAGLAVPFRLNLSLRLRCQIATHTTSIRSPLCSCPTAQMLLANCTTGQSIVKPAKERSKFVRLLSRVYPGIEAFIAPEDHYPGRLYSRQAATAVLWHFTALPPTSTMQLYQVQSARAGLGGDNCLQTTLFIGPCSNDAVSVFSLGGSALFPPASPAQPPANLGLIIGATVGGIAGIAIIGMGICVYRRKRDSRFDRNIKVTANLPGSAPDNVASPVFDPRKSAVELRPLPSGTDMIGGRPVSAVQSRSPSGNPSPMGSSAALVAPNNGGYGQQGYSPQQPQQAYSPQQQAYSPGGQQQQAYFQQQQKQQSPYGSAASIPPASPPSNPAYPQPQSAPSSPPTIRAGPATAAQVTDLQSLRGKQCTVLIPYAGKLADEVTIEKGDTVVVEQAWVSGDAATNEPRN